MVRVPIQVGVTVTRPCEISAPVTVSVDATGSPVVTLGGLVRNCDAAPEITVSKDTSIGSGYVVSIGF